MTVSLTVVAEGLLPSGFRVKLTTMLPQDTLKPSMLVVLMPICEAILCCKCKSKAAFVEELKKSLQFPENRNVTA